MFRMLKISAVILIILSLLPLQMVIGGPSKDQVKAFSNVKMVRLVIQQNYGEAKRAKLPVEDIIEGLLTPIGIKVTKSLVIYDAIINIKINGKPLGVSFFGDTIYAGGKLSGTISFEPKDKKIPPYKKSFSGTIDPLGNNPNIQLSEKMVDPSNAPFREVLVASDFYEKFIETLGELYGPSAAIECWIALLENEDYNLQTKAINELVKIGKRAVKPLTSKLGTQNDSLKLAVIETLGRIGDPIVVSSLIELLKDKDSSIRSKSAEALGEIRDKRAVEPLIAIIKDEDSWVRMAVAEALGKIRDPKAVDALISILKDEDTWVRIRAVEALMAIRDPKAVEPILSTLKDKNSSVRTKSAEALGVLKDPKAVPELIKSLKDSEADVRMRAAEALGKIGDKRAIEPLIESLKDEDWTVRLRAAEALGKIGDKKAVDPLISVLNDKEWTVRSSAADALGRLKDPKAVEPLLSLLKDKESSVRMSAIESLGRIKDKKAIEPLKKVANSDSSFIVRKKAKEVLSILQK
ncbi:MAG: HEAT repeat domain-containing protein [bacterium]